MSEKHTRHLRSVIIIFFFLIKTFIFLCTGVGKRMLMRNMLIKYVEDRHKEENN